MQNMNSANATLARAASAMPVQLGKTTAQCGKNEQCEAGRPYAFVVHGLWPQYERGYPEKCVQPAPWIDKSAHGQLVVMALALSLLATTENQEVAVRPALRDAIAKDGEMIDGPIPIGLGGKAGHLKTDQGLPRSCARNG